MKAAAVSRNLRSLACKGLLWGFVAVLAACAGAVLFLGYVMFAPSRAVPPSFQTVRSGYTKSDAVLLDRHLEVLHEIRVDDRGRRLDWTPLDEISAAARMMVLRAEDKRFYEHHGVDWVALAGSVQNLFGASSLRGASTISMQLASKLRADLQPRGGRRSPLQKLSQIRAARDLEKAWTKDEIFEAYLNLVTFRGELQGIAAASAGLFAKKPHGLDRTESLLLAALIRSPNASADSAASRAVRLARTAGLDLEESAIVRTSLAVLSRPYYVRPRAAWAPHAARELLASGLKGDAPGRMSAVSSLDGDLQRYAIDSLKHHLQSIGAQNVNDGAVLVVSNRTGEVLAYVGNSGEQASARYVDGIRARRQAGSTLKPFIYGLAFEKRILTPVSLIDDSVLDMPVSGGLYSPENYDNRFHGTVTARTALASSLNVPAVKVLNLIGVEYCLERLRNWGFDKLQSADYYGPSLALGSPDITLWELVGAYRALANGGVWSPLRMEPSGASGPSRRVLTPEAAFLVADILSDRESRTLTFSLESPLSTRFWTAVKTGTSKDMRDNWCVGFSDAYTVGVWAGNFSGASMWDVSGIEGAAPVWVDVINWLHKGSSSVMPDPPAGVTARPVTMLDSGRISSEWFIRGTETGVVQKASGIRASRIASPAGGTVVALDPDIPSDRQKMFFEASPAEHSMHWVLDGNELGVAADVTLWTPVRGRHTLSLIGADGTVVDTADFEVRGGE